MLALGFAVDFAEKGFLVLCLFIAGVLVLELARGVKGFVELRWDIVSWRGPGTVFGGVGGLPVEGLLTVAADGSMFSRGLRNMVIGCSGPWQGEHLVELGVVVDR